MSSLGAEEHLISLIILVKSSSLLQYYEVNEKTYINIQGFFNRLDDLIHLRAFLYVEANAFVRSIIVAAPRQIYQRLKMLIVSVKYTSPTPMQDFEQ
nr:hypothetical protein [Tanacetum cinerariifolium]